MGRLSKETTFFIMKKYYFYIVYSTKLDRYYIGHTNNLEERVRKHNTNHKGYTGVVSDWQVAYSEVYQTKSAAYRREREVKVWKSRNQIDRLIAGSERSD
jgi:putative endonuclease